MLEKKLEKEICEDLEQYYGMLCIKLVNPYQRGWPDRIVVPPEGMATFFIEFKAPGKVPTKLQLHRHKQLRHQQKSVFVIDSWDSYDDLLLALHLPPRATRMVFEYKGEKA